MTMNLKAAWLGAISLALASLPALAQPKIHNHAEVFLSFWEKNKNTSLAEQVAAFQREVAPSLPAFYKYKFERWAKQGRNPEETLGKHLLTFPAIEARFAATTRSLAGEIAEHLRTFQVAFDDLDTNLNIHILHSLGEMDGGSRTIDGKEYFLFGVDGIVKYHGGSDPLFFHHEFFHMYHGQHFVWEERIWNALWAEGLATYVSGELNPGSSEKNIVMDLPTGMLEKCQADMPYLWATLLEKLDSNSEEDYTNFFLIGAGDQRIPGRAGYYLGYLVAKEMRKGRTLKEMARLKGPELRKEVEAVVRRFASQP